MSLRNSQILSATKYQYLDMLHLEGVFINPVCSIELLEIPAGFYVALSCMLAHVI